MEKNKKNEERLEEIEKELANKNEQKQNLEARFENEKERFERYYGNRFYNNVEIN